MISGRVVIGLAPHRLVRRESVLVAHPSGWPDEALRLAARPPRGRSSVV